MDRPRRSLVIFGALLLGLARARGAAAQLAPQAPPTPAATLEVAAEPACAGRDDLIARVLSRSPRIRFLTTQAPSAPALRATIAADAREGATGELTVVEPDGRRFVRRLRAPSCAEAADALALVIALTLDPTAAVQPRGLLAAPSAATSTAAPATAASSAPAAAVGAPPAPPAAPAERFEPPPRAARAAAEIVSATPPSPGPPAPPAVLRAAAGVAAAVLVGGAPRPMLGAGLEALVALDRASVWSPAVRVSAAHVWTDGVAEANGTASFALDTVTLDACAVRARLAALQLRACASGLVGRLSVSGSNTFSPRAFARPYAAIGGSTLLTMPLGAVFELRGRLGAGAALGRDAFEFTPEVFYRVASVTLVGELGLGLRFP